MLLSLPSLQVQREFFEHSSSIGATDTEVDLLIGA